MIRLLLRHQLARRYATVTPWLATAASQLLLAWLLFAQLEIYLKIQPRLTSLASTLGIHDLVIAPTLASTALALLLLAPLLGMDAIAGERRDGRMALFSSSPVSPGALVLGKWLGQLAVLLPLLLLALAMGLAVGLGSHLDAGQLAASALGLLLTLALACAVTLWLSSLVEQPLTAAALSWGVLLLAWFIDSSGGDSLTTLSLRAHLQPFFQGLVTLASLGWFFLLTVATLLLTFLQLRRLAGSDTARRHRLMLLLVALATALALAGLTRLNSRWDWTDAKRNTLSQSSQAALAALDGPVAVSVYLENYPVQRAAVRELLEKYRRADHRFSYRFIDPKTHPEEIRKNGIVRTPTLLLHAGSHYQRVETVDESHLTAALARLGRKGTGWIGALTGHGEARLFGQANFDLGDFGRLLEQQGYRVVAIDATATGQIPENLDLLIMAAPATRLAAGEIQILKRYLDDGGNLLWLADGMLLPEMASALGISFLPGVVVDAAAAGLGLDRPTVAVARPADDHPVTRALAGPVLLPRARAIKAQRANGWQPQPLLRTGPRSWNETGALKGAIQRDPQVGEEQGPLTLAVALTRGAQRVAVVGGSDFLGNSFLGNGANRPFGLALVRWLSGNDKLIQVKPYRPPDQKLRWPHKTLAAVAALFLAGVPLVLAATGLFIAWRRRRV